MPVYSEQVRKAFPDCTCDKVGGGAVHLDGFPAGRTIIEIDCVMQSGDKGRRGDYAVVTDESNMAIFIPVEIKSRDLNYTKIKEQLEGVIGIFQKHLHPECRVYPLIVSKRPLVTAAERKNLLSVKVKFFKRTVTLKHCRRGTKLKWRTVKDGAS